MNVMILTVSSGEGHNAMGKALMTELQSRGYNSKLVDYYKEADPLRQWFVQDFYFWTLRNFPRISHRSYVTVQQRDFKKQPSRFSVFSMMLKSKKSIQNVIQQLKDFQPDIIYCTHVYTATLMCELRRQGKTNAKVFFMVSDYVVHPYTELTTDIDYLLTPNHDFDNELMSMGFRQDQLLPFGITVNPKFSYHQSKEFAREALGLQPNLPTFMIMNGGVGFGNSLRLVKELSKVELPFQLVIVNGRNEKMKKKIDDFIQKHKIENVLNYGFATNVDQIMDASDALIGKIGGVAITEAFNKGLTIIVPTLPPFQEYSNMVYLTARDAIIYAGSEAKTAEVVQSLLVTPGRIDELQKNVAALRRPNATKDFADFLVNQYGKELNH